MTLPIDYDARKAIPIGTGVLDYFPDALAEVAKVSAAGNLQHNPEAAARGELFWNRDKSTDEYNTCLRHLLEHGGFDTDGVRHSAKAVWRALALLQKELEREHGYPLPRACMRPEQRARAGLPTVPPPAPVLMVHDTQPSMRAVSPGSYRLTEEDDITLTETPISKGLSSRGTGR